MMFLHDLLAYPFLQVALLASLLSAPACGIVGSLMTVRRITYLAGAVAHCTLGGMGFACYAQKVWGWHALSPLGGAAIAAVVAALIVSWLRSRGQRLDTVLSAIWSVGMAIGLFFISRTPGYSEDLMSYLFGNIIMVQASDLWLMLTLDILLLILTFLFYPHLQALSFDEEFSRLRGLPVGLLDALLLVLTSLGIVLLIQLVGMVMVIALLALPAATASRYCSRLWTMMFLAGFLCLTSCWGGLWLSYEPNLPAGATIILLAALFYLGSWLLPKQPYTSKATTNK